MKMPKDNKIIKAETDLVDCVTKFLEKRKYKVYIEAPNMGQNMDIIALKGRWKTAIEAKLHNWRRGLEQCEAHEIVVDFIYIAISTVKISETLRENAYNKGYGIIHCNPYSGECSINLEAKKNNMYWLPQRKIFNQKVRRIANGY